jgi:hypothetical protein
MQSVRSSPFVTIANEYVWASVVAEDALIVQR